MYQPAQSTQIIQSIPSRTEPHLDTILIFKYYEWVRLLKQWVGLRGGRDMDQGQHGAATKVTHGMFSLLRLMWLIHYDLWVGFVLCVWCMKNFFNGMRWHVTWRGHMRWLFFLAFHLEFEKSWRALSFCEHRGSEKLSEGRDPMETSTKNIKTFVDSGD